MNYIIKIIIAAHLITFYSCKTKNFNTSKYDIQQNCMFKSYLVNELKEDDSKFDKAILLRTNFCGSELCSNELYRSMERFVKKEKSRVLIVINYEDTVLTDVLSKNPLIKVKIDPNQSYQRYGFQRPGHYAFLFNKNLCPTQYTNITENFIEWFTKQ